MTWKAIARSSVGTSHLKQQLPCQDYGSYCILGDVIVEAVADGAGSAKYANVGAQLAVKTALLELKTWVKADYNMPLLQAIDQAQAQKIFTEVLTSTITALRKRATTNHYSLDDLACTLSLFVATPQWIAAMQIGDGFIVIGSQEANYQLLFQPDKGEFINETVFITTATALSEMQICVKSGRHSFICAATDGLEKVAIRLRDWTLFAPFFQPLETYMRSTSNPEHSDEYLTDFLNSERLNARTDDDKTLLLCLLNDHSHLR